MQVGDVFAGGVAWGNAWANAFTARVEVGGWAYPKLGHFLFKKPPTVTRWSKHHQNTWLDWDGDTPASHCHAQGLKGNAVARGKENHLEMLQLQARNPCISIIHGHEGKCNLNSVFVTHPFCRRLYLITPLICAQGRRGM